MSVERMTSPDDVRSWIFTFGMGQEHDGLPMRYRFVRITGTFDEARARMVERFGKKWAFQYATEEDAGVERWHLIDHDAAVDGR